MNLSCRVVEDLLPLYHDGVCSQESRTLVKEHLKDCTNCQSILASMENETAPAQSNIDDTAPMKSILAKWTKSKRIAFLKGTLIAAGLFVCLLGGYLGLTEWKCIPVDPSLLDVAEVSQLADGRIICHLKIKDNRNLRFIRFATNEDGSFYMTPMRSVLEGKRTMEQGLFNDYLCVDITEKNAYQQTDGEGIVITSCYVGPQGEGILIWEEGMELPKASAALEARAK